MNKKKIINMKKTKKKTKTLIYLIMILGSNFFNSITFTESIEEIISSEEESIETWTEWFGNNYGTIALVTSLLFAAGGLVIYYFNPFDCLNIFNQTTAVVVNGIEIPVQNIEILLYAIQPMVTEPLFDKILSLIAIISEIPEHKEKGLEAFEVLLNTFKTSQELSANILNQDEFEQLLKAIIEEIKKK